MNFDEVLAPISVKNYLKESIEENRISHAQLFVGKPGWGTLEMALAYAEALIGEENEASAGKVKRLIHPDLHFSIPTFTGENKKEALTKNYIQEFKQLISSNHFASINDWYEILDAGNKQGFLGKEEIMEVIKSLSLKSLEGGYKVLIIWNADKMKTDFANKFLKLLEEPPEKTLFLLLAESTEYMLDTIISRCVTVNFKPLENEQMETYSVNELNVNNNDFKKLIEKSEGDIRRLQQNVAHSENRQLFEEEFAAWTRNAFLVKKQIHKLQEIMQQAERIASWNTEQQKQYLEFCIEMFRSALMESYQVPGLNLSRIEEVPFKFDSFSKFISGANIEDILNELNNTYYYLERNANKKLAFANLGIKLTRFIHKKPA